MTQRGCTSVEKSSAVKISCFGLMPEGLSDLGDRPSTLESAAGGIRTRVYQNDEEALAEVAGLARSMTYKYACGFTRS